MREDGARDVERERQSERQKEREGERRGDVGTALGVGLRGRAWAYLAHGLMILLLCASFHPLVDMHTMVGTSAHSL